LQNVATKAVKNNIIKQSKNKDYTHWTQPKDPFTVKMELLMTKCGNIYSEELHQHKKINIEDFLSPYDQQFIRSYSEDHFEHMIFQEKLTPPVPHHM